MYLGADSEAWTGTLPAGDAWTGCLPAADARTGTLPAGDARTGTLPAGDAQGDKADPGEVPANDVERLDLPCCCIISKNNGALVRMAGGMWKELLRGVSSQILATNQSRCARLPQLVWLCKTALVNLCARFKL